MDNVSELINENGQYRWKGFSKCHVNLWTQARQLSLTRKKTHNRGNLTGIKAHGLWQCIEIDTNQNISQALYDLFPSPKPRVWLENSLSFHIQLTVKIVIWLHGWHYDKRIWWTCFGQYLWNGLVMNLHLIAFRLSAVRECLYGSKNLVSLTEFSRWVSAALLRSTTEITDGIITN